MSIILMERGWSYDQPFFISSIAVKMAGLSPINIIFVS